MIGDGQVHGRGVYDSGAGGFTNDTVDYRRAY
jgi:hypothetical protein